MVMGVPTLNAKKKLAPPCTRHEVGANELKVFGAYPGTFQLPYCEATIWPSIFCAWTPPQQNNIIIKAKKILIGLKLCL